MPANVKRLAYFESWIDPIAERLLGARDDIELARLTFAAQEADTWRELALRTAITCCHAAICVSRGSVTPR